MKLLFCGLGSIGQRHINNIRYLFPDYEIIAYRKTEHNLRIKNGKAIEVKSLAAELDIVIYNSFDTALQEKPDIVFVTNPSSMHLDIVLKAIKLGCHVFAEKPLSHNLSGINELENLLYTSNSVFMVGYQNRFNPLYNKLHKIISTQKFGRCLSASVNWGTFLPDHHPYEDYTEGYAARSDLGGGAILCLSHDLDMIVDLWGIPMDVVGVPITNGALKMTAEESVIAILKYENEAICFPVGLYLSFNQIVESHELKVQFEHGFVCFDLFNNTLNEYSNDGGIVKHSLPAGFTRNNLFLTEVKAFINACINEKSLDKNCSNGLDALKLAVKIKTNMEC